MEIELELNKMLIHRWARQTNDHHEFNCDYWDCPHKIKQGDKYYLEIYPGGQTESFCLECSAYFMAQALNVLINDRAPVECPGEPCEDCASEGTC